MNESAQRCKEFRYGAVCIGPRSVRASNIRMSWFPVMLLAIKKGRERTPRSISWSILEFLLTLSDEIPGGSCRTTHQRCGFAIPKTHAKPAVIVFGRVRAKKVVSSRKKAIR